MKLKDLKGFPKKRKHVLSECPQCAGGSRELCQTARDGGIYNDVLSEIGEIDLDQWLKDNGWYEDKLHKHRGYEDPTKLMDELCKARGYIKLSDVELDRKKIEDLLMKNVHQLPEKGLAVYMQNRNITEFLNALSKAKDLLKLKGE